MNITVVGDVLLDIDLLGAARKLSPDGPVPVIDIDEETRRPGGAGLAALMLADLGHETTLVTSLGTDTPSQSLHDGLSGDAGVTVVAVDSGCPAPVKKRLISDGHVVARIDENCEVTTPPPVTDAMLAAIRSADAVLVSDYGRGLTADPALRETLTDVARHTPVVWDPHPSGAVPTDGVWAVTPNRSEALAVGELNDEGPRSIARAISHLLAAWPVRAAVVTLGAEGAALLEASDRGAGLPQFISSPARAEGDTCGAGDRFAGALTAELAGGAPLSMAVEDAVREAGAFIARGGVATLGDNAHGGERHDSLEARIAQVRSDGGTVVATGGCFDLLHAGHARTLAAARRLGDFLVVCLNSDDSVRRLKGEQRPIMNQADRVELLEALECVDGVVVFDEDTPETALERLRPDLWVKGGDYDVDSLPEAQLIRAWGGQAVTVPYHPARSTTKLAAALAAVS